jgi:hypothetical protein
LHLGLTLAKLNIKAATQCRIKRGYRYMSWGNSTPMRQLSLKLEYGPDGLSWWVQERTEEDGPGGQTIKFETLATGRVLTKELAEMRVATAGVPGKALPPGKLGAMMKYVREPDEMTLLCWAVLKRYSVHNHCGGNPPHSVRVQAYQAVSRAWKRVGVESWLRHLPTGFWNEELPSERTFCIVTQSLRLTGSPMQYYFGLPVDELLNPETEIIWPVLYRQEVASGSTDSLSVSHKPASRWVDGGHKRVATGTG